MRRQVVRSQVRLNLHQPAGQTPAGDLSDQHLAEQVASDLERVALEEVKGKDLLDEGKG